MKKIISLFARNYKTDHLVRNEIVPGAEWVVDGEGVATGKFDGTACMIKDNKMFKRYDVKKNRQTPPDFIPSADPDEVTGHWPGWVPVGDGPEDKWHREAFETHKKFDGIFELCGPKIQGNPEGYEKHVLISLNTEDRADDFIIQPPREFEGLKIFFEHYNIEGIVWHHPDGRMVKIKARDFGIKRRGN